MSIRSQSFDLTFRLNQLLEADSESPGYPPPTHWDPKRNNRKVAIRVIDDADGTITIMNQFFEPRLPGTVSTDSVNRDYQMIDRSTHFLFPLTVDIPQLSLPGADERWLPLRLSIHCVV
jgi:hypothetical protein